MSQQEGQDGSEFERFSFTFWFRACEFLELDAEGVFFAIAFFAGPHGLLGVTADHHDRVSGATAGAGPDFRLNATTGSTDERPVKF